MLRLRPSAHVLTCSFVVCGAVLLALTTGSAHAAAARTPPLHRIAQSTPVTAAAPLRHDSEMSTNWAGYAITGQSFSDVKGSWVVPAVDCGGTSDDTYSSAWIGLGGFLSAQALEQDGTDSYCWAGQPVYDAWYELVPAPPVTVDMTVAAGDLITADVAVNGSLTAMTLTDATSGETFTQTLPFDAPDVSAAEWIAESPAECDAQLSSCQVLPLANFGTMTFTGAQATAAGHTGTISDPAWQSTGILLQQDSTSSLAVPSLLTADGSGFAVAYETGSPTVPPAPATPMPPPTVPPAPITTPPPTTTPPTAVPPPVAPPTAKPVPPKTKTANPKAKTRPKAKAKPKAKKTAPKTHR